MNSSFSNSLELQGFPFGSDETVSNTSQWDLLSEIVKIFEIVENNTTSCSINISTSFNETLASKLESPPVTLEFPEYFKVLLHVLYISVLVGGVLGNSLVLYVLYSVPRMRTVTNYLLANLAVGDLIIATLCVPFTYLPIVFEYWPFGRLLCLFISPFNAIGVLVSAFTLIALAVEKYVAILHPLAPRLRKSRVWWIIALIWLIASFVASPIAFAIDLQYVQMDNSSNSTEDAIPICKEVWTTEDQELSYSLALMMIQYFVPLAVLAFTYTRIAQVVWGIQQERKASSVGSNGEINLKRNATYKTDKRSRKAVLLTLAVVAGYSFAWLPLNVNYIILMHCPDIASTYEFQYVYVFSHWLAMSHCFYNPVIYAWINSSFKNAFKDVIKKLLCVKKPDRNQFGTVSSSKKLYNYDSTLTRSTSSKRWTIYRKFSGTPHEPNQSLKGKKVSLLRKPELEPIKESPVVTFL